LVDGHFVDGQSLDGQRHKGFSYKNAAILILNSYPKVRIVT